MRSAVTARAVREPCADGGLRGPAANPWSPIAVPVPAVPVASLPLLAMPVLSVPALVPVLSVPVLAVLALVVVATTGTSAAAHAAEAPARVPQAGVPQEREAPKRVAPERVAEPPVVSFASDDGTRFVLVPTGGPPVVHWLVGLPAGPLEDPLGHAGLALAAGWAVLGNGGDAGAPFSAELARCPAFGPRGRALEHGLLVTIETGTDMVPPVARLLAARRRAALAGDALVAPSTLDPALAAAVDPALALDLNLATCARREREAMDRPATAALLDELAAIHFLGHPFGRMALTRGGTPATDGGVERGKVNGGAGLDGRAAEPAAVRRVLERVLRPERMVHVLVGGFRPLEVESVLRREFGASGADALPPLDTPTPPRLRAERVSKIPGPRPAIAIAASLVPDVPLDLLELVEAWLAGGDDAALRSLLRAAGHGNVRVTVRAPWPAPGPGAAMLLVVEGQGDTAALSHRLLAAVDAALAQLVHEGPGPGALQRALAHVRAQRAARFASPARLAKHIAARMLAGESGERALRPLPQPRGDELAALARALLGERRSTVVQEVTPGANGPEPRSGGEGPR